MLTPELGKVRGLAFILPNISFSDYSSAAEWANKIANNEVFVIPNTGGTVAMTPVEISGLGETEVVIAGYDVVMDVMDGNIDAQNEIKNMAGNRNMRA